MKILVTAILFLGSLAAFLFSAIKFYSTNCVVGKYGNEICGERAIFLMLAIFLFFVVPSLLSFKSQFGRSLLARKVKKNRSR